MGESREDAGTATTASAEKAVDVAIAEFSALRAEILSRSTAQATLVGIGLTAIGLVVGLVVKDKGDTRLLLAIPAVAFLVNVLGAGQGLRCAYIGAYIRRELWQSIGTYLDRPPSSWEAEIARRRRRWRNIPQGILIDGTPSVLFSLSSVVAMIVVSDRHVDSSLLWGGWALTGMAVVIPVAVALATRGLSNSQPSTSSEQPRPAASHGHPGDTSHETHTSSSRAAGAG